MSIDLFERYARLDPAKVSGAEPEWRPMSRVLSPATNGRELKMQTQQQIPTEPKRPKLGRTGSVLAGAALILVLVVGSVILISTGDSDQLSVATSASSVSPADGLAVANAFYVAYNNNDVDGVMALFRPDATFSDNFTGESTWEEEEMRTVWNAAQGTMLTSQGCSAIGGDSESSVLVACGGATHNAETQAVGGPPVPTDVVLTVTADGISDLRYEFGNPDFYWVGDPFLQWMRVNHPEDAGKMIFASWTGLEEAREFGLLIALYAEEWASYLDANGCTFSEGC